MTPMPMSASSIGWMLPGASITWTPIPISPSRAASMARNSQIADFSLVQYLGTEPGPSWSYNGAQLGYYEYARVAISGGKSDFNPVYELEATMGTLCNDLNDRAQAVNQAVANGV